MFDYFFSLILLIWQRKRNGATKKPAAKAPAFNVLEQSAFSPSVSQDPIGPPILNEKSAVCVHSWYLTILSYRTLNYLLKYSRHK